MAEDITSLTAQDVTAYAEERKANLEAARITVRNSLIGNNNAGEIRLQMGGNIDFATADRLFEHLRPIQSNDEAVKLLLGTPQERAALQIRMEKEGFARFKAEHRVDMPPSFFEHRQTMLALDFEVADANRLASKLQENISFNELKPSERETAQRIYSTRGNDTPLPKMTGPEPEHTKTPPSVPLSQQAQPSPPSLPKALTPEPHNAHARAQAKLDDLTHKALGSASLSDQQHGQDVFLTGRKQEDFAKHLSVKQQEAIASGMLKRQGGASLVNAWADGMAEYQITQERATPLGRSMTEADWKLRQNALSSLHKENLMLAAATHYEARANGTYSKPVTPLKPEHLPNERSHAIKGLEVREGFLNSKGEIEWSPTLSPQDPIIVRPSPVPAKRGTSLPSQEHSTNTPTPPPSASTRFSPPKTNVTAGAKGSGAIAAFGGLTAGLTTLAITGDAKAAAHATRDGVVNGVASQVPFAGGLVTDNPAEKAVRNRVDACRTAAVPAFTAAGATAGVGIGSLPAAAVGGLIAQTGCDEFTRIQARSEGLDVQLGPIAGAIMGVTSLLQHAGVTGGNTQPSNTSPQHATTSTKNTDNRTKS